MTIQRKRLPIAVLERIDDLCTQFERCWRSGTPQAIETFLSTDLSADARDLLLSELLVLEIDYRRQRGESPTTEEYVDRFPNNAQSVRDALGVAPQNDRHFVAPSLEQIAKLFPALEVISLLGTGGMGAVYQARQKGLDRLVALKILPNELGQDVKFALRFTREARTLARLNHPNIVSVHEFGNVDEIYYFLMEFVDGSTLRDVVQAGQLEPQHALAIVPHLCDALQYAHDHDVVHRDIKPENILMAKNGSVKIADFGLSRIIGGKNQAVTLTQANQVLGTPRYMAPEQFEGAHVVDHRADIYSLGVVFYEMLTGELPIGRFAAPSQKVQIDVRLDEVVFRTLEKEPKRRYQAASEIKSDLQSISSMPNAESTRTLAYNTREEVGEKRGMPVPTATLERQETAARLLLSRRELMDRVKRSLRPLHRAQVFQILFGVFLIFLGAQCWARSTHIPHRLICGLIVHIYGIIVIGGGAYVCTRVSCIDYSKPVGQIRAMLDRVRKAYLLGGPLVGFPWWLMWIPILVTVGLDVVLNPYCLWVSLAVGIPGWAFSAWLHYRYVNANEDANEKWRKQIVGESLSKAYRTLLEIEQANID